MVKTLQALFLSTLLALSIITIAAPSQANANILDFHVVGVQMNPNGARTIWVDILDVGNYGCNWHNLYLYIDGVHYPINGWNVVGSNGVVARAWFYVPSYFGTHQLQLAAVFPVTVPSPYYPGYVVTTRWEWSFVKFYTF